MRVSCLRSWGILAVIGCLGLAQAAEAQVVDNAERDRQYEALSRETTTLERQSNVLKTVVRLVRPTVVHIEADKLDNAIGKIGPKDHVEEAGSGYIARLNDHDYILTNRHVIKDAANKDIKIRLADGRFVAAVRMHDNGARTSLAWVEPATGKLTEFLKLPSGGDTSYAGLVFHDGLLWVSYYSSHEGKTSIYLAKVQLPAATSKIGSRPGQHRPTPRDGDLYSLQFAR